MKILLLVFCFVIIATSASAQKLGYLASVLQEDCQEQLELIESKKYGLNHKSFCFGYVESVIEHKINLEKIDVYGCFPSYGDYDHFKTRVINKFIRTFSDEGVEYSRAFNLVRKAFDEEFTFSCLSTGAN